MTRSFLVQSRSGGKLENILLYTMYVNKTIGAVLSDDVSIIFFPIRLYVSITITLVRADVIRILT